MLMIGIILVVGVLFYAIGLAVKNFVATQEAGEPPPETFGDVFARPKYENSSDTAS